MSWPQTYCPKCEHRMSHAAIIKTVGRSGYVYRCPKCKHEFGVRRK